MKIERILVPTDFSRHSLAALQYAIGFAQEHQAEIIIVHAVEPLPRGMGRFREPTQLLEQWQEEASAQLDRLVEQTVRRYPKCRGELHFGSVYGVIGEAVRKLKPDLIIVATHGRTGLRHMVMGSIAEKIVRYVSCPVLIIKATFNASQNRGKGAQRPPGKVNRKRRTA